MCVSECECACVSECECACVSECECAGVCVNVCVDSSYTTVTRTVYALWAKSKTSVQLSAAD